MFSVFLGSLVGTVRAYDVDEGENGKVTYFLRNEEENLSNSGTKFKTRGLALNTLG